MPHAQLRQHVHIAQISKARQTSVDDGLGVLFTATGMKRQPGGLASAPEGGDHAVAAGRLLQVVLAAQPLARLHVDAVREQKLFIR